ncbi:fimbrial biogenesis chaperone [Pseudomonas akapageensis]|uniref:fimbrial biogenesis chaperone n=1 Tax=Pseudomonas akapageensis TaxID=2609961 RepID=UPI0014078A62|nr:molecular chaperone [Pseudomonas akapageensis]
MPAPRRQTLYAGLALCSLLGHLPAAQAALTLNSTRVVFESDKRSTSVIVANPSEQPYAVQSWVNTEADDTTTPVPFIAAPALFKVNPGKEQLVQINGLPNDLPGDRESLFFFNAQELPQASESGKNVLNIALRTRIKLFYRPSHLKENPSTRLKDLQWSFEQVDGKPYLVVDNPSPFHFTFSRLEVEGGGQAEKLQLAPMALPLARQSYALKTVKPGAGLKVTFTTINDYGGYTAPMTQAIGMAGP